MRFSFEKSKIWIIIFGILFIFSLNFFQKEIKNFFYLVSSPIQKFLWEGGVRLSNFIEMIFEMQNLKKENEELKLRIQELLSENIQISELNKENVTLREALGVGLEKDFKLEITKVIGKDISQDFILINKGQRDQLTEDLPVITPQKILVGKIGQVYKNFSKVALVSNKENSFDVKIQEKDLEGVAKGVGNFKLSLELVPKEKEIETGDLIVTTSLTGIFPKDLLVGQITKVKRFDVEPFQMAEIKPAFDIKEMETLFIITEFQ